ncbi:hypothetical protein L6452_18956 [Arctium lappa]|uniref:Uncharacterized protein n=1 Tax=Arctium lappa TaxID=4217 RepID=A0ACB9B847_ARCLA|nr:hypothetical protein L6452_18956 [Arctium lappa]
MDAKLSSHLQVKTLKQATSHANVSNFLFQKPLTRSVVALFIETYQTSPLKLIYSIWFCSISILLLPFKSPETPRPIAICNVISHIGASNHKFKNGDVVPIYANKVGPFHNPSETCRYFDLSFCLSGDLKDKRKRLELVTPAADLFFCSSIFFPLHRSAQEMKFEIAYNEALDLLRNPLLE